MIPSTCLVQAVHKNNSVSGRPAGLKKGATGDFFFHFCNFFQKWTMRPL